MGDRAEKCSGSTPGRIAGTVIPLLTVVLLFCAVWAQAAWFPELTQDGQKKKNGTIVDIGHADQGYIQVCHQASSKKLKVRVSNGDMTYTYDLNGEGEFEVFPLQMGSGSYRVGVYEQVKGSQYQSVSNISFDVEIADSLLPFLYPNQYAWYEAEDEAVAQAEMLCEGLNSDEQKVEAIERFVTGRFMYDYMKAVTIRSATGYLPDIEKVYSEKKGICFDFAALVCCMLRTQGIPTQMVIGYADATYHAWNSVYVDGQWRLIDTTAAITGTTVRQYTPELYY